MSDDVYARVGAAIRSRRDAVGMTQASLATRTGLARTSITNIEKGGQALLVHQLLDVARALRTDPQDLLADIAADGRDVATPMAKATSGDMADLLSRLDKPVRVRR